MNETLNTDDIKAIFSRLQSVMSDNRDYLIDLDNAMGDGDLGLTMVKAFNAAATEAERSEEKLPGKLIMRLGMVMAKAAPSTMGTLLATGFMRGGKAIANEQSMDVSSLAVFFEAFTLGIIDRGKTQPGNKTIVDTIHPASETLKQASSDGLHLHGALSAACEAAEKGLADSTQMRAQHGRAAYYREKSIGIQDPGATVGLLIIKTFKEYVDRD